jgi:hypothetical protein
MDGRAVAKVRGDINRPISHPHRTRGDPVAPGRHVVGAPKERFAQVLGGISRSPEDVVAKGTNAVEACSKMVKDLDLEHIARQLVCRRSR